MRDLIFHNFWLKTFSVALATVIWLAIHYGIQHDETPSETIMNRLSARQLFRVPVSVVKLPSDARAFKVYPTEVTVAVTGEEPDLGRTSAANLKVFVDLTDFPSNKVVLTPLHAEAPAGVAVRDLRPASVTVEEAK
ncbi:MAG TPA: CdaR family protein [Verrucomicrobiae bacterium]|jgi:hypothetical protein|nr:CdaR family protein [Verrucomicrobiae bacterium]